MFTGNFRPLLGYALRRTTAPEDAADVVAETFLVAWRRLGDVPSGADARPWLFGVARRTLSNQTRGALRRSQLADRLRAALVVDNAAPASSDADVIAAAMDRLDGADREILRLTGCEGLSPSEIAVVMAIPPATARTRLHRARRRLRSELLSLGWNERTDADGHVPAGERLLAQDAGCE